jgi:hypothetical protein
MEGTSQFRPRPDLTVCGEAWGVERNDELVEGVMVRTVMHLIGGWAGSSLLLLLGSQLGSSFPFRSLFGLK